MVINKVLIVPRSGDPHGLLSEGVCGARAPLAACVWDDGDGSRHVWVDATDPRYDWAPGTPRALVLAWDGRAVMEGCYRLGDALERGGVSAYHRQIVMEVSLGLRGELAHTTLQEITGATLGEIILG